jgi:hypothetical protein
MIIKLPLGVTLVEDEEIFTSVLCCAAVDVIQLGVRQNAWLCILCHFAYSLLS